MRCTQLSPTLIRALPGVARAHPRRGLALVAAGPVPEVVFRPSRGGGEMDLAARAASDPQTFALLYRRYVDSEYRYCYRGLGNREATEDATQVIFEKVIASLPRFTNHVPFKAWLFTIAHNTIIDISVTIAAR